MAEGKKNILIAVDGSRQSMDAVRYVSRMLPSGDSRIVLFHVLSKYSESAWDRPGTTCLETQRRESVWEIQQKNLMDSFFERAVSIFQENGFSAASISRKIHPRKEGVARDIIAEADQGYDAVVTGRVGMNPAGRLVMGSVATKLIDNLTRTSLWVIGGAPDPKTVLVGIDSSEETLNVVSYVGRMLSGSNVEFTLFHVIRSFDATLKELWINAFEPVSFQFQPQESEAELENAKKAMVPVFRKASEALESAGISKDRIFIKIITGVATRGGTLYAQAIHGGFGTIVVGRRGLSRVENFSMGRVGNKVVQLCDEKAVWIISR